MSSLERLLELSAEANPPTERFLEGKSGLVIDSLISLGGFLGLVEDLGGKLKISQYFPDDLLEIITTRHKIDFLIVHNYILKDKAAIIAAKEAGVEVILIRRVIHSPEEREKYVQMHQELAEIGVYLGDSSNRWQDAEEFLQEIYSG